MRTFKLECARTASADEIFVKSEEGTPSDTAPIGIVLGAKRDDLVVQFATEGITNRIFVSRYQLYLPDKEQLRRELAYAIEAEEGKKRANKRKTI